MNSYLLSTFTHNTHLKTSHQILFAFLWLCLFQTNRIHRIIVLKVFVAFFDMCVGVHVFTQVRDLCIQTYIADSQHIAYKCQIHIKQIGVYNLKLHFLIGYSCVFIWNWRFFIAFFHIKKLLYFVFRFLTLANFFNRLLLFIGLSEHKLLEFGLKLILFPCIKHYWIQTVNDPASRGHIAENSNKNDICHQFDLRLRFFESKSVSYMVIDNCWHKWQHFTWCR